MDSIAQLLLMTGSCQDAIWAIWLIIAFLLIPIKLLNVKVFIHVVFLSFGVKLTLIASLKTIFLCSVHDAILYRDGDTCTLKISLSTLLLYTFIC